ncbi:hypothetical protein RJ641_007299 [Dillenia turbinata]|uniref:Uncharacterized protein n=1 Tax=Dillenia turbinata TaxID=194707 RepID=A0AAN8V160_9MAGN
MPLYKLMIFFMSSMSYLLASNSWCPHNNDHQGREFEQKANRFWIYTEQSNSWVEVKLPYDLISCVNGNCTKVGTINSSVSLETKEEDESKKNELGERKRGSLIKVSDTSMWVTGESGSIYERFWNGVQWVIAPHDLPISAGYAVSVFIVNKTILSLSESGNIYQMRLNENSQPVWTEFMPSSSKDAELIKSGVVSHDGERVYFCTKNGSLLELSQAEPPRWVNHGRPPGANVAAIADAGTVRSEVVFVISSIGDLYEFDKSTKPSWKKHIWRERSTKDASLIPTRGCTLQGVGGPYSTSLFLLTKGGTLVERRLQQRKWKWMVHASPKHQLTSIAQVFQDESNDKFSSLFFTTAIGSVYEHRLPKHIDSIQEGELLRDTWINHMHPQHAKVARNIGGVQIQVGRIMFYLDDGRLGQLHFSGLGGESSGPITQNNIRRKSSNKYLWSILDAPETEGWNAEYCTEERGPSNCFTGMKDEPNDSIASRSITRRRKGNQDEPHYLTLETGVTHWEKALDEYIFPHNWINTNFHLRVMHGGRSFFLITDGGEAFEYLSTENMWLWLRHEHSTAMQGALGNYNGSLFLVDTYGSLLIRERSGNELAWINCTAMRRGRQVIGGPPWDGMPSKALKVTAENALFFVSKTGRLLQFTVALRKFKWKDCKNPPNTKIASIVDQELFRDNIVFVIGRNGRLYQYNKVTELWHEHYQSQHLVLSRMPGTAIRPSTQSLTGSLFMVSENGGLVEYHWNSLYGWNWVEHGTPYGTVTLVGSPGPCFEGNQLLLIGSDGKVYLRYLDQETWKWKNFGFPYTEGMMGANNEKDKEICVDEDKHRDFNEHCDPKVALIRPIPFSENSVIFELRDRRLAELQRTEETQWVWTRTIGTPTSLCMANFWAAVAS